MLRHYLLLGLIALVAVTSVSPASASKSTAVLTHAPRIDTGRVPYIVFFDDMESGANGWQSFDNTAAAPTHFHVSTFNAFDVNSWYCGDEALTANGGYGNSWDDRLDLPVIDLTGSSFPVWTFAYRYDSEPDYDFAYVQVDSLGTWINLNRGYNGSSAGWQDYGLYGFQLANYGSPLVARYRFSSDGAYSDSDGDYDSDGGAFSVDNIKIFDFMSGTVYFFDDAETGGLCTPSVPAASGDYWHLIDRSCPAFSDPHSWWCGEDADTTRVPPNLNNSLMSPAIDIAGSASCTLRMLIHAEVPTVDDDYWTEHVSTDGGANWHQISAFWGDFGQCDGWGTSGIDGYDLTPYLPGTTLYYLITFHTTDNGCGPGAAGGAGIMLDDIWVEDWTGSPVEETSWGRVKSLYR